MSNDTISKIKLRLNNNLKIKQSKKQIVSALSNRMYANSQTSNCNDYFANCCNCCNPPVGCICCECLAGFIITIEGWEDGTCDCSGLNVPDGIFVPRITCGTYNRECELHGGTAPEGVYPNYVCPDPEGSNVTNYVCSGGQFPGIHYAGISWELYCIDGQLYLKVYHASNKSLSVGIIGGGSMHIDGFGIWSLLFAPVDCDDLEISGVLGGSCSAQCICSAVTFTATPVFGGPLTPPECQCCGPERCESTTIGCLNPYPETLTITLNDNCSGNITTTLTRNNEGCWQAVYDTLCEECVGDEVTLLYTIEIYLCCTNGNWEFKVIVVNPDSCEPFSWKSDPNAVSDATALMNVSDCNPMSFSGGINCGTCEWRTCNPSTTIGNYCITSFSITE